MERYSNRDEFRKSTGIFSLEHDWLQKFVDEHYIQALGERRVAAAFAVAILSVVAETPEISERGDSLQKIIRDVVAECQSVLEDNSVYILDDFEISENSKFLEGACQKALKTVSQAGNLCNNLPLCFSNNANTEKLILQARDMCDSATKRAV
jgi:hypothetical protein